MRVYLKDAAVKNRLLKKEKMFEKKKYLNVRMSIDIEDN